MKRLRETGESYYERTLEFNDLRGEIGVLEGKVYSEKKDLERLEGDHRDAASASNKNYQEISRLKDLINVRELDNRGFQSRISAMEAEVD